MKEKWDDDQCVDAEVYPRLSFFEVLAPFGIAIHYVAAKVLLEIFWYVKKLISRKRS